MVSDDAGLAELLDLYEDERPSLYRLARILGSGEAAEDIVRAAMMALHKRLRRIVDPQERIDYLREQVVHMAKQVGEPVEIPDPDDERYQPVLCALRRQGPQTILILVVSHYLGLYGPDLAEVMRMSVRSTNRMLEGALERLRKATGDAEGESVSQELSDALHAAATQIKVSPIKSLEDELRERKTVPGAGRVRSQLVVTAALAALAVGALTAVAVSRPGATQMPSVPDTDSSTPLGAAAPVALQAVMRDAPVYYVGRADRKLYREYRRLPVQSNLAKAAVESLFTLVPRDPDYLSKWTGQVLSADLQGDLLTIDLSADAYAIPAADVPIAIDELVYTAADVLGNRELKVKFLSVGQQPPQAFRSEEGHGIAGLAPMPAVWITSPANQSTLAVGTLSVIGTAQPDSGAPVVTITNSDTNEVIVNTIAQTTLTENAEGWLTWSVTAEISIPGTYELVATSQSGLAGQPKQGQSLDTKTVTVVNK